jgi:hypothetical protein
VKKMRSMPGGARSARRAASSSAAGWAVPHSVLKASLESCSPATAAISSPWLYPIWAQNRLERPST